MEGVGVRVMVVVKASFPLWGGRRDERLRSGIGARDSGIGVCASVRVWWVEGFDSGSCGFQS